MAQWTAFAEAIEGLNILLLRNADGVQIGDKVNGPGIPDNTIVDGTAGFAVTLNHPVTHTFRNMPVVFRSERELSDRDLGERGGLHLHRNDPHASVFPRVNPGRVEPIGNRQIETTTAISRINFGEGVVMHLGAVTSLRTYIQSLRGHPAAIAEHIARAFAGVAVRNIWSPTNEVGYAVGQTCEVLSRGNIVVRYTDLPAPRLNGPVYVNTNGEFTAREDGNIPLPQLQWAGLPTADNCCEVSITTWSPEPDEITAIATGSMGNDYVLIEPTDRGIAAGNFIEGFPVEPIATHPEHTVITSVTALPGGRFLLMLSARLSRSISMSDVRIRPADWQIGPASRAAARAATAEAIAAAEIAGVFGDPPPPPPLDFMRAQEQMQSEIAGAFAVPPHRLQPPAPSDHPIQALKPKRIISRPAKRIE